MNYNIRKINSDEYELLNDFLYEAIYIPQGVQAPPKSIINAPELQVYVVDFGKKEDDICFLAEVDEKVIGAVWVRVMNDYGHIEAGVPSFAISLYKEYRGYGIGTALMKGMLCELRKRGYEKTSLAVQKTNYAVKMYKNVGFEIVDENEEEYIMMCRLKVKYNSVSTENELLENLDKLHTTKLGLVRIKRNLSLDIDDVVEWCKDKIHSDNAVITRKGKNWYINVDDCIITVNAYSYTIITAHKKK